MPQSQHHYNGSYNGEYLNRVAFPLGGIGAGMICLEGTGALKAAQLMGETLGKNVAQYAALFVKGKAFLESKLYNGDYFFQQVRWQGLRAGDPTNFKSLVSKDSGYSSEARELLRREGPKYQYGSSCLSGGRT